MANGDAKTGGRPRSLAARIGTWLRPLTDRRQAVRSHASNLCAHYWSGGVPRPHAVIDISEVGAYVETRDHWHLGTIIEMTVQSEAGTNGGTAGPHPSLHLVTKVVRSGPKGIGVQFLYTQAQERLQIRKFLAAVQPGRH